MSAHGAAKLAGVAISRIHSEAIAGRIRTHVVPGITPKYHREDVLKLQTAKAAAHA